MRHIVALDPHGSPERTPRKEADGFPVSSHSPPPMSLLERRVQRNVMNLGQECGSRHRVASPIGCRPLSVQKGRLFLGVDRRRASSPRSRHVPCTSEPAEPAPIRLGGRHDRRAHLSSVRPHRVFRCPASSCVRPSSGIPHAVPRAPGPTDWYRHPHGRPRLVQATLRWGGGSSILAPHRAADGAVSRPWAAPALTIAGAASLAAEHGAV